MKTLFLPALRLLVALSLITGVAYPLLVTGIASVLFPRQAGGSLVREGDVVVGSALVGQRWTSPRYFAGRPSATTPEYNAAASGGSNLGPLNPALSDAVKARVAAERAASPDRSASVPVDLVTTSGSGLDPHLSPAAAAWQVERVAKARGLGVERVRELVAQHTEAPLLGVFGEWRVNVLLLNRALDAMR